jgi:hypothetical protein
MRDRLGRRFGLHLRGRRRNCRRFLGSVSLEMLANQFRNGKLDRA